MPLAEALLGVGNLEVRFLDERGYLGVLLACAYASNPFCVDLWSYGTIFVRTMLRCRLPTSRAGRQRCGNPTSAFDLAGSIAPDG